MSVVLGLIVAKPRGKKRIAGSRDCLYPRIANGSSVSPYRQWILCILCIADGSCVSPIDPVYRRWILCIADRSCVSPMDPVYRQWILCILDRSFISSLHSPLGLVQFQIKSSDQMNERSVWTDQILSKDLFQQIRSYQKNCSNRSQITIWSVQTDQFPDLIDCIIVPLGYLRGALGVP